MYAKKSKVFTTPKKNPPKQSGEVTFFFSIYIPYKHSVVFLNYLRVFVRVLMLLIR